MSSWSCPHQTGDYYCQRVKRDCEPGMKGCVLRGKVRFAKDEDLFSDGKRMESEVKNTRKRSKAS